MGGVGKGKEKELPRTLVRARRARSLLIAKVIEMCPNIQQLDCEVSVELSLVLEDRETKTNSIVSGLTGFPEASDSRRCLRGG